MAATYYLVIAPSSLQAWTSCHIPWKEQTSDSGNGIIGEGIMFILLSEQEGLMCYDGYSLISV